MMKLPEPFNGRAVGRVNGTGVLVEVAPAPAPNVTVRALDGSFGPEARLRTEIDPLTTRARDILAAEVETETGVVRETMEVSVDRAGGGVRRERRSGGEAPPK